ncbi:response regulator [Clostridium celatum]|uniref:Transcriptional regulatory protein n=1 Tax=Clostridium celatum DSM 1785 TaxID=545697 RepID=L1Q3X4_9CLOT|nr:response regulator [Clostridium celatum]EKY22606.1 putative transcriptional regulatory protein DcuR [Clostridium celatum DSM 1785]MCE9655079.1 response regulator [Clostridium celatum]MDU2266455.1 response regulator [Clostridium celatum]MDU3723283.1 response regulator [Clostridium celatum]MDU6296734.1 response regulator [Clostridium celatum]
MINVLIVEDDPMVAFINKRYLEQIGGINVFGPVMYEKDIINILESEKIDLILLDVFLPQKSGIDILKSLRNKSFFTDIIMITAANSSLEVKKAFAYGVVDYLVKPFEFKRLKEAVDKFKLKNNMMQKDNLLTQKEIDKLLINDNLDGETTLPKGLNKKTLDKILSFLNDNSNKVWTLREIAYEIKISNVTVKKYMDYLEKIDKIKSEMTFGNVGRPEHKYTINK